jgi:uncharacterized membrane protein YgdD (TMEM256/DUF423 family)
MLIVPLQPVVAQTLSIALGNQPCQLRVYQNAAGLFVDLYVNNALIIGGVIALNGTRIVRDVYLGFAGDLFFADMFATPTQPGVDPTGGAQLGVRWLLFYLEASEIEGDV